MIHINYVPRLLKNRNKILLKTFLERFLNLFSIPLLILEAFNVNSCKSIPYILLILSIVSTIYYVNQHYQKFVYDIVYMSESGDVQIVHKISLWIRDAFIQFTASILTFWWIGNTYTCVPLHKIYQGYIWIFSFVLLFVLHLTHVTFVSNTTEKILKHVYNHVEA